MEAELTAREGKQKGVAMAWAVKGKAGKGKWTYDGDDAGLGIPYRSLRDDDAEVDAALDAALDAAHETLADRAGKGGFMIGDLQRAADRRLENMNNAVRYGFGKGVDRAAPP